MGDRGNSGRVGGGARGDELAAFVRECKDCAYSLAGVPRAPRLPSRGYSAYYSPGSPSGLVALERDIGLPVAGGGGGVAGGTRDGVSSVVASTA